MTCGTAKDEELIERYARHQLNPEEQRAFEEHFFSCDGCFAKVQVTERFIAGVRDAARRNLLDSGAAETEKTRGWWLFPGFALSSTAAVVLAALVIWVFLIRLPGLRRDLNEATARLHSEQSLRADLEKEARQESATQGNVPFVMLEATRGSVPSNEVTVPAAGRHLLLWAELGGESRFRSFRLEVYAPDHQLVETVPNLSRNSYGAVVVNLAAQDLESGDYLLRLFGEGPAPPSAVGEYRLRVRRP
jgi:hypothetical protein